MRVLTSLLLILLISGCQKSKKEFNKWWENQSGEMHSNNSSLNNQFATFYSSPLQIDTIYRSMQGPYEIKQIRIQEEDEELLWIVGYKSEIINVNTEKKVAARYMCHNNLNYADTNNIPWKLKTSGDNSRIFTLSEGQTELNFPEGFGIPVPADQSYKMVSQVLNHNNPHLNLKVKHKTMLKYLRGSESGNKLSPLYQQSVFITKQISGPPGEYGLSKLCLQDHLDSTSLQGKQPKHDCSVDYSNADYNPYKDLHGRIYTGHWKLPYGEETLKTDVTRMLDLIEETKIHMIGVHLHPYAEGLEFWDKTADRLLYQTNIQKDSAAFGFENISYFKSKDGISVYPDHNYELISHYNCTDSTEEHTAMAVMYLYLADQ